MKNNDYYLICAILTHMMRVLIFKKRVVAGNDEVSFQYSCFVVHLHRK